jgi:hypothetical protein
LRDATGIPLLELELDSTSGGFWLRRAAGAPVYRVSEWEADELVPADSTLRRRTP